MTTLKVIAHIETDFATKLGVPRQSGLVDALRGRIVFEPEYRVPEAFRGLEGYSHIWLLWCFSEAQRDTWTPTVRPPRLGGNARMGVFATRSPFRPNPIGLSSVRLLGIEIDPAVGPVLHVAGADLMDGTPIYDVKPYLSFTDAHPDASGGFTDMTRAIAPLEVVVPDAVAALFTADQLAALRKVLAEDPRPHYQQDDSRIYGMAYAGHDIHFRVEGSRLIVSD